MLFLPPRPPLQLPVDGSVLIGRSSEAQLRVNDADTSRRHAEIVCRGGRFLLRDLTSTNGTFVNDRRIEEYELQPGDRIEIGENHITFCHVEADLDDRANDSASTVFREQPTPGARGRIFSGDLSEIPPYAVVQILELGRKTGELSLEGDVASGRIWLLRGDPVHAETKGQVGFDAALTLVNVSSGRFAFEPTLDTPQPTIEASVTQLLLEASRLLDERDV
jgi:pSer/pThr/pTyr-binding forkhead associated (FHA) protein